MSLAYFSTLVDEQEYIRGVIYPSVRMVFPQFGVAALVSWASLYWYIPLEQSLARPAYVMLIMAQLFAVYVLIRIAMYLKYTAWIVTSERVLDVSQKGLFGQDINEEYLNDLYRPSMRLTMIRERLFGLRTLRLYSLREKAYFDLAGVAKPQECVTFLRQFVPSKKEAIMERLHELENHDIDDSFDTMLEELSDIAGSDSVDSQSTKINT